MRLFLLYLTISGVHFALPTLAGRAINTQRDDFHTKTAPKHDRKAGAKYYAPRRSATRTNNRLTLLPTVLSPPLESDTDSVYESSDQFIRRILVKERQNATSAPGTDVSGLKSELLSALLEGYDKSVAPTGSDGGPVQVEINLALQKIITVGLLEGNMDLAVWFRLQWVDPRLSWNATDWGVDHLYILNQELRYMDIWCPDVTLWNSAYDIATTLGAQAAVLTPDGRVTWARNGQLSVVCNFKGLASFPFGTVSCLLEFGTWALGPEAVVVREAPQGGATVAGNSMTNLAGAKAVEWKFHNVHSWIHTYPPTASEELPWPVLLIDIQLHRTQTLFALKILVPQVILALVGFMTFWLSPECGERLAVAVTIPLALAVYDLLVYSTLPASDDISCIGAIGLLGFLFSVSALAVNGAVVQLYHYREPRWWMGSGTIWAIWLRFRQQQVWCLLLEVLDKLETELIKQHLKESQVAKKERQALAAPRQRRLSFMGARAQTNDGLRRAAEEGEGRQQDPLAVLETRASLTAGRTSNKMVGALSRLQLVPAAAGPERFNSSARQRSVTSPGFTIPDATNTTAAAAPGSRITQVEPVHATLHVAAFNVTEKGATGAASVIFDSPQPSYRRIQQPLCTQPQQQEQRLGSQQPLLELETSEGSAKPYQREGSSRLSRHDTSLRHSQQVQKLPPSSVPSPSPPSSAVLPPPQPALSSGHEALPSDQWGSQQGLTESGTRTPPPVRRQILQHESRGLIAAQYPDNACKAVWAVEDGVTDEKGQEVQEEAENAAAAAAAAGQVEGTLLGGRTEYQVTVVMPELLRQRSRSLAHGADGAIGDDSRNGDVSVTPDRHRPQPSLQSLPPPPSQQHTPTGTNGVEPAAAARPPTSSKEAPRSFRASEPVPSWHPPPPPPPTPLPATTSIYSQLDLPPLHFMSPVFMPQNWPLYTYVGQPLPMQPAPAARYSMDIAATRSVQHFTGPVLGSVASSQLSLGDALSSCSAGLPRKFAPPRPLNNVNIAAQPSSDQPSSDQPSPHSLGVSFVKKAVSGSARVAEVTALPLPSPALPISPAASGPLSVSCSDPHRREGKGMLPPPLQPPDSGILGEGGGASSSNIDKGSSSDDSSNVQVFYGGDTSIELAIRMSLLEDRRTSEMDARAVDELSSSPHPASPVINKVVNKDPVGGEDAARIAKLPHTPPPPAPPPPAPPPPLQPALLLSPSASDEAEDDATAAYPQSPTLRPLCNTFPLDKLMPNTHTLHDFQEEKGPPQLQPQDRALTNFTSSTNPHKQSRSPSQPYHKHHDVSEGARTRRWHASCTRKAPAPKQIQAPYTGPVAPADVDLPERRVCTSTSQHRIRRDIPQVVRNPRAAGKRFQSELLRSASSSSESPNDDVAVLGAAPPPPPPPPPPLPRPVAMYSVDATATGSAGSTARPVQRLSLRPSLCHIRTSSGPVPADQLIEGRLKSGSGRHLGATAATSAAATGKLSRLGSGGVSSSMADRGGSGVGISRATEAAVQPPYLSPLRNAVLAADGDRSAGGAGGNGGASLRRSGTESTNYTAMPLGHAASGLMDVEWQSAAVTSSVVPVSEVHLYDVAARIMAREALLGGGSDEDLDLDRGLVAQGLSLRRRNDERDDAPVAATVEGGMGADGEVGEREAKGVAAAAAAALGLLEPPIRRGPADWPYEMEPRSAGEGEPEDPDPEAELTLDAVLHVATPELLETYLQLILDNPSSELLAVRERVANAVNVFGMEELVLRLFPIVGRPESGPTAGSGPNPSSRAGTFRATSGGLSGSRRGACRRGRRMGGAPGAATTASGVGAKADFHRMVGDEYNTKWRLLSAFIDANCRYLMPIMYAVCFLVIIWRKVWANNEVLENEATNAVGRVHQ